MPDDDDRRRTQVRQVRDAPYDPGAWRDLLATIALEAGVLQAQLIIFRQGVPIACLSSSPTPDGTLDRLRARFVTEAWVGEWLRALRAAEVADFVPGGGLSKDQFGQRRPMDLEHPTETSPDHNHALVLLNRDGTLALLNMTRTTALAAPHAETLAMLLTLQPTLSSALRHQMEVETRADQQSLALLDTLGAAAIYCDEDGRIQAATAAGHAAVRGGRYVKAGRQVLGTTVPRHSSRLSDAIRFHATAAGDPAPGSTFVLLSNAQDSEVTVAEVAGLRSHFGRLGFGAGCVVMIGRGFGPRPDTILSELGLTNSEIAVAKGSADGLTHGEISIRRGVKVATVRAQLKSIYAKIGATSQRELNVRLRDIL